MSSKINITEVVVGHFRTLRGPDGKLSFSDVITFVFVPISLGLLSAWFSFNLNSGLSSLLVNFGSIFTALLLSVLVLVYDQESKLEDKKAMDGFYDIKKELLRQLYYNISYSILCSVALVLFCFVHSVITGVSTVFTVGDNSFSFKYDVFVVTPIVVVVCINLFLNILMVVKRMHALLVSQN